MVSKTSLALYGGKPVRAEPLPVMHPGSSQIDDEEISAVLEVLKSQSLYRFYGPKFLNITGKFEKEFKEYIGVKHALAVSSGTAALHTTLVGLSVEHGDEVILPTYGWVACPDAIVASGATPVEEIEKREAISGLHRLHVERRDLIRKLLLVEATIRQLESRREN